MSGDLGATIRKLAEDAEVTQVLYRMGREAETDVRELMALPQLVDWFKRHPQPKRPAASLAFLLGIMSAEIEDLPEEAVCSVILRMVRFGRRYAETPREAGGDDGR